jgi:hypothetical protein
MNNPGTLATLATQDTGRRKINKKDLTKKTKQINNTDKTTNIRG